MENKLQRNQNDKMIAGVAFGIAEYLKIEAAWVRLAFVLAVFAGLSGILIYIILWIAIPAKPYAHPFPDVDYKVYQDKNGPVSNKEVYPSFPGNTKNQGNARLIAGLILIFLGVYFLSDEFNFLPYWVSLDKLWPLALIIPGILILAKAGKKDHQEEQLEQPDQDVDKKQGDIIADSTKDKDQSQ